MEVQNEMDELFESSESREKKFKPFNSFDPKDYLDLTLGSNEESKKVTVRFFPIDGKKYNRIVKTHNVTVDQEISKSGFKNFICSEKTEGIDNESYGGCPFCELNRNAYKAMQSATTDEEKERYKKIMKDNMTSDTAILNCIERGKEEEGLKFIKVNIKQDGSDILGQIKSIYKTRNEESINEGDGPYNVLSLEDGKDFSIEVKCNKEGKRSYTVTDLSKKKPAVADKELFDKIVSTAKSWDTVFKIKNYDYLKVIAEGSVPRFSKKQNKYVSKEEYETESNSQNESYKSGVIEQKVVNVKIAEKFENASDDNTDEELPF